MPRLSEIESADRRGFRELPAERLADRRERLRIALVMIGSGLLRRNAEGGVRSEELGVGGVGREQR
jgi:hypothetical protein